MPIARWVFFNRLLNSSQCPAAPPRLFSRYFSNRMPEIPSEHRRLFPLTLPPIDLLFFYDDFPDYPMSFYIELEFSGSLDRERMNAALDEALSRHPLLFSRVLPGKRNRPSWTPAPELATTIRWRNWGEPLLLAEGEEVAAVGG